MISVKKIALLSAENLEGYILDDDLILAQNDLYEIEEIPWNKPNVDWALFDAAVIRTTWDYCKNLESFLSCIAKIETSTRLFNPSSIVHWNSNKHYLQDLAVKGVKTVPSFFMDQGNFKEKLSDFKGDNFVLKPVVGASASDIQRLTKEKVLDFYTEIKDQNEASRWFVQPFVEEVLEGERSLIFFNGTFSHAVRKVPKGGDFRVQEEHGARIFSYEASEEELLFAQEVVDFLEEPLLYARVDFLKTAKGCQLMELELIEPSLYLRYSEVGAKNFLEALETKIGS